MGGGVMRAASKAVGFAVASGGHYPVGSATRRAASLRPATSTAEEVKLVASNLEGSVQRQSSAVDDWVFAVGDEEVVFGAGDSMQRVVFGGVPSLQEAKDATSELTAALEKTYLSSNTSAESEGSVVPDNVSSLQLANSQIVKANAFVGNEVGESSHAIMAFKYLQESPIMQNVVASVACDQNVWNAVLQNQEVQGFLQSQRACMASSGMNTAEMVVDSNVLDQSSMTTPDNSSEAGEPGPAGGFIDILEKIRGAVVNMMTSLSDFFVNLFGGGRGANGAFANTLMERSIIGLAVMAILVILLKRA